MRQKNLSVNALIIVCMLCDIIIRPFYSVMALNARTSIVFSFILSAFITIIVLAFIAIFNDKFENVDKNKTICLCYYILFIFSSAASIVKTEQFYRYTSSDTVSLAAFLFCIVLVCVYASFVPSSSLLKSAKAVFLLLIFSLIIIIISNQSNISFQNLQFNLTKSNSNLWYSFNLAPEILLFMYLDKSKKAVKLLNFTAIIFAVFAVYFIFAILGELVLGTNFVAQSQPLHTLARLGNLSVFKRIDSFHTGIWLLCMTVKISTFFSVAVNLLPEKFKLSKRIIFSVIFILFSCGLFYSISTALLKLLLNVLTAFVLALSAIFLKARQVTKA